MSYYLKKKLFVKINSGSWATNKCFTVKEFQKFQTQYWPFSNESSTKKNTGEAGNEISKFNT